MALAHVQGLEVVPVGLHLGPLGDLEAEPDEHVLEPLPGLGDDVRPARVAGLPANSVRSSRSASTCRSRATAASSARLASSARGGAPVASLSAWPGLLALVDGGERAELGLQLRQRAPLAEQLGIERGDLVERRRRGDAVECRLPGGTDVVDQRESFRGEPAGTAPGGLGQRRVGGVEIAVPGFTRGDEIGARAARRRPSPASTTAGPWRLRSRAPSWPSPR